MECFRVGNVSRRHSKVISLASARRHQFKVTLQCQGRRNICHLNADVIAIGVCVS